MTCTHRYSAIALATMALCLGHQTSLAQSQNAASPPERNSAQLDDVSVSARKEPVADLVAPSAQLSGTGLVLRGNSSLGETLNGSPGVSSTYFGPQASRPIVRGMDGDRVRILSNAGSSLDVSGLSYDHAVSIDPLIVERIEMLRGPSALVYGGNAIGGVVNLIDGRIPRERVDGPQGRADLSVATGDRSRSGVMVLETGSGDVALHADVYARKSGELAVPVSLPCNATGSLVNARRLCNSAASSEGGALGGTIFFPRGHLGLSLSSHSANYGSVADDQSSISMLSQRMALEGLVQLEGWIRSVKGQFSYSDYRHTEFDAGVAGTVFTNKGSELRLEARHGKLGAFEGLLGLQTASSRFGADGAEAFAPNSQTRNTALFVFEEAALPWGKLNLAGRIESVRVESQGSATVGRFVPDSRSFTPGSLGAGAQLALGPSLNLKGNLTWNQRAPKDHELFADGPHLATAAYEVGNAALDKERSTHLEVGLEWRGASGLQGKRSPNQVSMSVFSTRFQNYLSLEKTGRQRGSDGTVNPLDANGDGLADGSGASILPEYRVQQQAARLHGFEINGSLRLPLKLSGAQSLDLLWRADYVKGINSTTGALLPRMAPLRLGATLVWSGAEEGKPGWGARAGLDHYARAADQSSAAYTFVNASLSYQMKARVAGQDSRLLWYARFDNMSDRLAFSATSVLTQSLPGRVPLPGRSLRLGVQWLF